MSIPVAIKQFLEQTGVECHTFAHPEAKTARDTAHALGVDLNRLARAALLHDERGVLMAVYPASYTVDLNALNRELSRKLQPMSRRQLAQWLPRCSPGYCPPLAGFHEVEAAVHEDLANAAEVYFAVSPQELCRVSGSDFCLMQGPAWYASAFARPGPSDSTDSLRSERAVRMRAELQRVDKLPAMPRIAQEILQISVNPYANAADLAAVIEQDPSLTAQLVRYASSPFYGYRGKIESLREVIARVLGYDMVIDIALGIVVGRSLRNPPYGPLGLNACWRHATYNAALAQVLAPTLTDIYRPRPGMAYLAGLLHNFGLLVLGHLFPDEFRVINDAAARHPDEPLVELEGRLLGVTHTELGGWLMEAWQMPEELIIAVREHHNPDYRGPSRAYANLVLVANRALKGLGLGDEGTEELPGALLEDLGLTADEVQAGLQRVLESSDGLEAMARQMAA